jgi:hypothetical protein
MSSSYSLESVAELSERTISACLDEMVRRFKDQPAIFAHSDFRCADGFGAGNFRFEPRARVIAGNWESDIGMVTNQNATPMDAAGIQVRHASTSCCVNLDR